MITLSLKSSNKSLFLISKLITHHGSTLHADRRQRTSLRQEPTLTGSQPTTSLFQPSTVAGCSFPGTFSHSEWCKYGNQPWLATLTSTVPNRNTYVARQRPAAASQICVTYATPPKLGGQTRRIGLLIRSTKLNPFILNNA